MKAKDVCGHLLAIYDGKAKAAGFDSWSSVIEELRLGDEEASEVHQVLIDMIEHQKGGV